jgi:hypothetical protein
LRCCEDAPAEAFSSEAAIHPDQHHLDFVRAAVDELLAGQGRQIEHDSMHRAGDSACAAPGKIAPVVLMMISVARSKNRFREATPAAPPGLSSTKP